MGMPLKVSGGGTVIHRQATTEYGWFTVQRRYSQVLSSIITPNAHENSPGSPTSRPSTPSSPSPSPNHASSRFALAPSRLFSYFSLPTPSYSTSSQPSTNGERVPLLDATDSPRYRPTAWSDTTMRYLTQSSRSYRPICASAVKVLDAPEIEVGYESSYLGLLSLIYAMFSGQLLP